MCIYRRRRNCFYPPPPPLDPVWPAGRTTCFDTCAYSRISMPRRPMKTNLAQRAPFFARFLWVCPLWRSIIVMPTKRGSWQCIPFGAYAMPYTVQKKMGAVLARRTDCRRRFERRSLQTCLHVSTNPRSGLAASGRRPRRKAAPMTHTQVAPPVQSRGHGVESRFLTSFLLLISLTGQFSFKTVFPQDKKCFPYTNLMPNSYFTFHFLFPPVVFFEKGNRFTFFCSSAK